MIQVRKSFLRNEFEVQKWFFDRPGDIFAFDTETDSITEEQEGALDYSTLTWAGVSFCDGRDACYVNLDVDQAERDRIINFLRYIFEHKIQRLVAHNIQYDLMVLHKYGIITTDVIFCTQVAAHLLDENQSKKLKPDLVWRYIENPGHIVSYKDVMSLPRDSEEFMDYGLMDSVYAWELHKVFVEKLKAQRMIELFFKEEMPFQMCLLELHKNGVLVDVPKLQEIEDQMEPIMRNAEDKMLDMLGKKAIVEKAFWEDLDVRRVNINFNSNKQVIPILMNNFGIELTELTDSGVALERDGQEVGDDHYKLDKIILGGTKLDEGVIGGLAADYPFCRELLIYRMAKDIRDKFTKKMKECLSPDGRIRCNFNDTVASTGRLSSSEPNLQNLRKLNAVLGVECRSAFIAPPGKSFIVADFSGQELRILAFVTQDPTLIKAYQIGFDLHLVTANLLFDLGLTEEQLTEGTAAYKLVKDEFKVFRHKAKNGFNFPVVYGSTEHGISRNIGISVEEAKRLLDKFMETYPGIARGFAECEENIKLRGYVKNAAGRRRRFPEGFTNRALRQAFNFLIQGYAADMLRLGMVQVLKLCKQHPAWGMRLVLTVHDEVVLEVNDESLEEAKHAVHEAMVGCVNLGIPIECDVGSGKTYAEAK